MKIYAHNPEEDRLKAIDILKRHFPEIGIFEVRQVGVEIEEGYAIVSVFRYAKYSHTDGRRFIDAATGEVAMLPTLTKSFPASGLFSP